MYDNVDNDGNNVHMKHKKQESIGVDRGIFLTVSNIATQGAFATFLLIYQSVMFGCQWEKACFVIANLTTECTMLLSQVKT